MNLDNIVFKTRDDAYKTLETLVHIIDVKGIVRVSDFYDLVAIAGRYTDTKVGWSNLDGIQIEQVKEGYHLKMPVPKTIIVVD